MKKHTLITGWNGFFGNILTSELERQGANLIRCGRVLGSDVKVDLALSPPDVDCNIDRVIHAAGVTPNAARPVDTPHVFNIGNVKATSNLLVGLGAKKPKSFVLVSSVSVYGKTSGELVGESEPLCATSEYAKSKMESETLVSEWCHENNIDLTIVRLPLVVGIGASGALGQLINAIKKRRFVLPGNGSARKSMVLASDVAEWLVANPNAIGTFNLTDRLDPSYAEICNAITDQLNIPKVPRIPVSLMKSVSLVGDSIGHLVNSKLPYNSLIHQQLTEPLTFSSEAATHFNWAPNSVIDTIHEWLPRD